LAIVSCASKLAGQERDPYPHPSSEPVAQVCAAEEHRQFDFWIGDWEVTDSTGAVAGTNVVSRVANGCGLQEYWRGAGGGNGTSLNWYDPQAGEWHQLWVGLGVYLYLTGGLEDGAMVLAGERQTPNGKVTDRIVWTPLEDGRVRQVWDMSSDGGRSWQLLFDGLYTRR
jgi:hypothetical protein